MTQNTMPAVSVVMSVFDEADHVYATVASVLAQQHVDLELLVVSDGAVPAVLAALENIDDARLTVIYQENAGLTQALINGCERAHHPLIARIDAGDIMLPNRLVAQAKLFTDQPNVGFVACWVRMETQEGYYLYTIDDTSRQINEALLSTNITQFKTPFHASTMFRKSVYQQVGGYRPQFYFAQDADLWARMIRVADFAMLDQAFTKAVFSVTGISGRYNRQQLMLRELIVEASALRAKGLDESLVLERAALIRPNDDLDAVTDEQLFDATYFLAKVLHDRKSPHAREYWWRAIRLRPTNLKVWYHAVVSLLFSGSES